MIIDAYTFCYNEQIRLKYYLNLYSPLCRKITIYDNGSTDASKEIATKYDNVIWETETYNQNEINDKILTNIKNNCWKQSKDADLVIVCDVDEILYHKDGLNNYLLNVLNETDKKIIRATGFDMVSTKLPTHTGNFYDDEDFQYGVRNAKWDKTCIFCPKSVKEIRYNHGSHQCKPIINGSRRRKQPKQISLYDGELKLLHYKYLSKKSFIIQQKQSGERIAEFNKKNHKGWEYLLTELEQEEIFDEKMKSREKII
tara:strand:- start:789 stop:1556 length:768 start_codon:yes stop_codon:yes gene_type:complete